ncbi:MAG: PDZ domain-containing protein [Candidatus Tectomicrobia bacterium]
MLFEPKAADFNAAVAANWPETLAELTNESHTDPRVLELLTHLAQELEKQQVRQAELEAVLVELQARSTETSIALAAIEPVDAGEAVDAETNEINRRQSGFRGRRGKVQQADLIKAGFTAYEADQIVLLADTISLNRLNLEYQATREGWRESPEYRERMRELPSVRDVISTEHGEDAYDRYLYASGRSNRVIVTDVYTSSAAAGAGLQAGDKVIAMADTKIYSARDLRSIATSGSEGELVPVTVERQGVRFEVFLPRGPLGVRTDRGYENPSPPEGA